MSIEYPYQNLSLVDIAGEQWKPIKGFEERYEVSSLGRIKTLARERILHHGGIQKFGPRIRKAHVETVLNKKVNDLLYSLLISLNLDGYERNYSIGRLVYDAFVAPFDLDDKNIYISYLDGDGRNLHYSNLLMSTMSAMRIKSYSNGRADSLLTKLSKPVTQFNTEGQMIRQFKSMRQAEMELGYSSKGISSVANGECFLFQGYCWQFGKAKTLRSGKLPFKKEGKQINTDLMKKLGIRQAPSPLPAYLDLGLSNRKGEQWKDFPGYEGLYKISNYGRVKALKRVSEGKQQKWYPETIKYLTIAVGLDSSGKKKVEPPVVTLCKNQVKKTHRVARWVYYLFVKPFSINDASLRVYCLDKNPLHIWAKNLVLLNASASFLQARNDN